MATELPNSSPASVFSPLMYAPAVHLPPVRVKRYAAPDSSASFLCSRQALKISWMRNCWTCGGRTPCPALFSRYEVTASELPSPLNASLTPNELYGRALGALINDCSLHVVPFLTNTYAAPTQIFAPRPGGASSAHPGGSMPGVRHASSPEPTATVLPSELMDVAKDPKS